VAGPSQVGCRLVSTLLWVVVVVRSSGRFTDMLGEGRLLWREESFSAFGTAIAIVARVVRANIHVVAATRS
jgi:hypothetical protein